MSQLTTLDKIKSGKGIIDSKVKIKFKEAIHPLLLSGTKIKVKYKLEKVNDVPFKIRKSERPVIFACNHTNEEDAPQALKAIKDHAYVLVGKQPLEKMDEMFFNLNGVIFVDRDNKEDMVASKDAMVELLKAHKNLLVFPEATWQWDYAQMVYELRWGIIEVAQRANAIIVPTSLVYDYDTKKCKCKFGEVLDPQGLSKKEGIDIVHDRIGEGKWDLFELNPMVERKSLDIDAEKAKIDEINYSLLNRKKEESYIYHSHATSEEVFEPINRLRK